MLLSSRLRASACMYTWNNTKWNYCPNVKQTTQVWNAPSTRWCFYAEIHAQARSVNSHANPRNANRTSKSVGHAAPPKQDSGPAACRAPFGAMQARAAKTRCRRGVYKKGPRPRGRTPPGTPLNPTTTSGGRSPFSLPSRSRGS